jgi:hypothetical protein
MTNFGTNFLKIDRRGIGTSFPKYANTTEGKIVIKLFPDRALKL